MNDFEASDWVSACAISAIALLGFVAMFQVGSDRPMHVADISDDNVHPIAVAITPVPLLKQGGPAQLPASWTRKTPAPQPKPEQAKEGPKPSTQAEKTPDAIPKEPVEAGPTTNVPEASTPTTSDTQPTDASAPVASADPNATPTDAAVAAVPSGPGDPNGSPNGTETDPLKARALDRYKASVAAWLRSNFRNTGGIPFEKLKTLRATAVVTASADRTVTGFTISAPSGDSVFDGEVRAALQSKVGATLPAPPPAYPEFAAQSIPVGFSCTIQSQCE